MQQAVLWIMVAVLLGAAFAFARGQWRTLRWLRDAEQLPSDDRGYFRNRAVRRLIGCGMMAILAGLLVGLSTLGVLQNLDALVEKGQAAGEGNLTLTPEEEAQVRFGYTYVGVIALVLLVLLALAFVDLIALRRFGMRHRKRIRDDRQAMLERQLPLLRQQHQQRNGQARE